MHGTCVPRTMATPVSAKVESLGWTERFNNLKSRFPTVEDEKILKALELHKGHAGGCRATPCSVSKLHAPVDDDHGWPVHRCDSRAGVHARARAHGTRTRTCTQHAHNMDTYSLIRSRLSTALGKAADDIQKTTLKYQVFGPDHGHGRSFWFFCG